MIDRFSGDPKIYLTPSGAEMVFTGGQPVMDSGLENLAGISLFTAPGWWGNSLTLVEDEQIGSDFEETALGAITLQKLADIKVSGENALANPAFGDVDMTVTNPVSWRIDANVLISPPGQDAGQLLLSRNGQNWVNQAQNPAYEIAQPPPEPPSQMATEALYLSDDELVYISDDEAFDYESDTFLI